MLNSETHPILVAGVTGKQGGAVVRALLKAGRSVRGLVRDPASAAAQALAAQGVEIVKGDYHDSASLDAAMEGAWGVFSVQMGSHPGDPDTEVITGKAFLDAAKRASVDMVVHTSVARGRSGELRGLGRGSLGAAVLEQQVGRKRHGQNAGLQKLGGP